MWWPKCLAPARPQASNLMRATTTSAGELLFFKTRALRSFQSSHEVKMTREAITFFFFRGCVGGGEWTIWSQQDLTSWNMVHSDGSNDTKPNQFLTEDQTCEAKRHWNRRCATDSGVRWQRGKFQINFVYYAYCNGNRDDMFSPGSTYQQLPRIANLFDACMHGPFHVHAPCWDPSRLC